MTVAQVLQFMQETSKDTILQKQLEALMGAGDGNISNTGELDREEAQALKGERGALVAEFAHKNGFQFSQEDLSTVIDAFQRYQSEELSLRELSEITGVSESELEAQENLPSMKQTVEYVYRGIRYLKSGDSFIPLGSNKPQKSKYRGANYAEAQDTPVVQVLQFMQKTSENVILQKQLEALMGTGDGNISSTGELDREEAQALKGNRGALVAEFAHKNGFQFSQEDLNTVVEAFERHQSGELSEEGLSEILGMSKLNPGFFQKAIARIYRGARF